MTTSTAAVSKTRPSGGGRQPSEQAIDAAIDSATRLLRLPTLRDRYAEIADAAGREQLSYRAFLSELLLAECDDREERRAPTGPRSGLPSTQDLGRLQLRREHRDQPRAHQHSRRLRVGQQRPVALPDRRQRHRQKPPAHRARDRRRPGGHRVRYVLAAKLVNELVGAAGERQLSRTIARYGRVELLCLDELGYMELDKRGAELLFQVLTEREEKTAVAIASNDSFSGWTKTFTDPRLCAAIVDRLTFGGNIIETGTSSYRLAHARTQRQSSGATSSPVTLGPSQVDTATGALRKPPGHLWTPAAPRAALRAAER